MIDVQNDKKEGLKIIKIAEETLKHHHTKACRKHGGKCRFRFPKFPIWKTIMSRDLNDNDLDKKQEKLKKHKEVLDAVLVILEDTEIVEKIMDKYDKSNETIQDYKENRKKRILEVLKLAKISEEEYIIALQESCRKGISIILQRDIDEIYINNYNPEWLLAWDGNIDIQPCFDFFGVITYITEYFTKDESGTSSFLAEASKQIKALPIMDQRKCIKNVFLTHRQMGVSEAFMKIFPEIRLKDSNIGT